MGFFDNILRRVKSVFTPKRPTIIKAIKTKTAGYYRSLIQVRYKGKNGKDTYDFLKARIWINDDKEHNEQELRYKLRDMDKEIEAHLGAGIGEGNVTYDVAFEIEEIAKSEVDNLGEFQYFADFGEGYTYDGII